MVFSLLDFLFQFVELVLIYPMFSTAILSVAYDQSMGCKFDLLDPILDYFMMPIVGTRIFPSLVGDLCFVLVTKSTWREVNSGKIMC